MMNMGGNQTICLGCILTVFVKEAMIETLVAPDLHSFRDMSWIDPCSMHGFLICRVKQGGFFEATEIREFILSGFLFLSQGLKRTCSQGD